MPKNDVQRSLGEGWEPAPIPPVGPDGGIELPPMRRLPVIAPPSLCEAGPCVNYHRFEIQIDAQDPVAERVLPGGQLVGDGGAAPFHPAVHRYCYPHAGVETELGELPVMACNRWMPIHPSAMSKHKQKFFETPDGRAYLDKLHAWKAAQRAEADAAAAFVAEMATETFKVTVEIGGHHHVLEVDGNWTVDSIRQTAVVVGGFQTHEPDDWHDRQPATSRWLIYDSHGNELVNPRFTLAELDIRPGALFVITQRIGKGA